MSLLCLQRQIIVARNEGKIKSYGSCTDLRAWSHVSGKRDRYLREWIKTDMPVSVIPTKTLICFLRTMTNKNRGKVTPRCHPNCKSKFVLESICSTCSTMKECLKEDEALGKYFEDEEFDTCHWPCERCLEALKCIKMFWRVIVEKVFRITLPKKDEITKDYTCSSSNVRHTSQKWQSEMIRQAYVVKKLNKGDGEKPNDESQRKRHQHVKLDPCSLPHTHNSDLTSINSINLLSLKSNENPQESPPTHSIRSRRPKKQRISVSRFISVKVKTNNVDCQTEDTQNNTEESGAYINNLNYLQQRFNVQNIEIERLKKENNYLKIELRNYCNGFSLYSHLSTPNSIQMCDQSMCLVPEPFDNVEETSLDHSTDSEMVITMKNCRDRKFTNVSLLQVLHKTNDPSYTLPNETGCRREDPTVLLEKMHDVLNDIVRREIGLVNEKGQNQTKISKIDASFHKVLLSRSSRSFVSFVDNN